MTEEKIRLHLPLDTQAGLPYDPHTLEPHWVETPDGYEVEYTLGELATAHAMSDGSIEHAVMLMEKADAQYYQFKGPIIKALSIRQPWAHLIVMGYKDFENRTWRANHRGGLYIHASKTFDKDAFDWIFEHVPRLHGWLSEDKTDYQLGGIVGSCIMIDCVEKSTSPWFTGPYGFHLIGAHPLPFVPLRGQMGIFDCEVGE